MKKKKVSNIIWNTLKSVAWFGVISFIITSCYLVWSLALVMIIHLNPKYDIDFVLKIVNINLWLFKISLTVILAGIIIKYINKKDK